jgi:L,D-peptidoglycan transpeptidase YkuD (ErfK/YbiS/YcfS/YnhG family)
LPTRPIGKSDGWCDDPNDVAYNRAVTLPYAGRHERLWRDDHLYDIVVVLDHNTDPVVRGAGSAVFLHLARENFAPTEGCVAASRATMLRLLARAAPGASIRVG